MLSLKSALWVGKTLLLSPSNPLLLPQNAGPLWVSRDDVVTVRESSKHLIVEAKDLGDVHLASVKAGGPKLRLSSIDDSSYQGIQRCPSAPLRIQRGQALWTQEAASVENHTRCAFKKLRLDHPADSSYFEKKERQLLRAGFQLLQQGWQNGRRFIVLNSGDRGIGNAEISKILGAAMAFYDIRQRKLPTPGNTLVFQLTLFEFSRSKARQLGVRWPQQYDFQALGASPLPRLQGENTLELISDFGEQHGVGKIIAQPSLRATPGVRAEFQSGGQIPIVQSSIYGKKTDWKDYGLILELQASTETKAGDPEVRVDFNLELSEPDEGAAIDGVPGILKRRLNSTFDLSVGVTTVLSSLLRMKKGKDKNGLPLLGQLPLVSYLFSSESSRSHNSELWFAIRPTWESLRKKSPDHEDFDLEY